MRARALAAAMAAAMLLLGGGARAAERLQVPELVGWKVVSNVADRTGEATELIPANETRDTWTRRVTVQAFRGVPLGVPDFLEQLLKRTVDVCEGATAGPPSMGVVGGAKAGTRTVACGRYKGDGRGTFSLFLVIRGQDALYVVSRLWRGEPFDPSRMPISAAELQEWSDFVGAVDLCDSRDPNRPCR